MKEYLTFPVLTDTDFTLSFISKDQFLAYHNEENVDSCLVVEAHFRCTDAEAKAMIAIIAKCNVIEAVRM